MNKKILYLTFLVTVLIGCDRKKPEPTPDPDEPTPTTGVLKINIIPRYNGSSFAFYSDYYNPLNQRVQFEKLTLYITNLYAFNASGDSVSIKDAYLYDLNNGRTGFQVNMNPGEFTGIKAGFGVDDSKNHLDPTTYDPSHSLSYNIANTMHWGWASGYIFMKCEAKADLSGTGTGPLNQFIAWHPGNDVCYRWSNLMPKNFSVTVGSTTTLNFIIDLSDFMVSATDTLDLSVDHTTHYTDFPGLAKTISTHVVNSFSVE